MDRTLAKEIEELLQASIGRFHISYRNLIALKTIVEAFAGM
jgi:hypothetical protein